MMGYRAEKVKKKGWCMKIGIITVSQRHPMSVSVLFNLRAAFDTVDHHILLWRMEKWLGVLTMEFQKFQYLVKSFILYLFPLGSWIDYVFNIHSLLCWWHLAIRPRPNCDPNQTAQLLKLQTGLRDIRVWMSRDVHSWTVELIPLGPNTWGTCTLLM